MEPRVEIGMPAQFASGVAGSDAERRAALALADRLSALGRSTDVEPFRFHQRWALAQAIACAIAVVGSVVSVDRPAVGAALIALAAASSIVEATTGRALLSLLTGVRASQNVSSPPNGGAGARPGLLVIAAGYDAPRPSALSRLAERVGRPLALVGAALLAVLACAALRVGGQEGDALTAVQLVPTLLLLAAIALLVDAELAPAGGARDAVGGVEVALELAAELEPALVNLDVWLVLTGAQGARGAGMRAWRRRHRRELRARPALTIEVGAPTAAEAEPARAAYADLARRLDAELNR
jgi:hypothetical protein